MSGPEILGVVSGSVTLIETVIKVIKATNDLRKNYEEVDGTPRAFQEVINRLPLMVDTLQQFKDQADLGLSDQADTAIKQTIRGCESKANQLHAIFKDLAPYAGQSRIEMYRLVVRRMGDVRDKKVESLAMSMMQDLELLARNWFIVTTKQAMKKAMDDLSKVQPSLGEDSGGDTGGRLYNYGTTKTVFMGSGNNYNYGSK
jgi:hypothetical protein